MAILYLSYKILLQSCINFYLVVFGFDSIFRGSMEPQEEHFCLRKCELCASSKLPCC